MGIIEDKKKFKRTVEQTNPANLNTINKNQVNQFDIDKATIRDQKSKK